MSAFIYHPETKTFMKQSEVVRIAVPDSVEDWDVEDYLEDVYNDSTHLHDKCHDCGTPAVFVFIDREPSTTHTNRKDAP